MAMSVLGGSRRSKLLLIAAIQVVVILYLGYWYSPLVFGSSTSPDIPQWDKTTLPNPDIHAPAENAPSVSDAPASDSPTGDENKSPPTWPSNPTTTQDAASEPDPTPVTCSSFDVLQASRPGPFSTGWRKFPMVRPPPACRTFKLPALEALIERMKNEIADPDLFRLFEN